MKNKQHIFKELSGSPFKYKNKVNYYTKKNPKLSQLFK
jgi:hypothetical protein